MKKVFQTLFLTVCLCIIGGNTFAGELPIYDEEIAIADATDPTDPEQERALIPTCRAYKTQGVIDVTFHKVIGKATILILNQAGRVVESVTVESEFEPAATLPAPTGKGGYILQIMGSTGYLGQGSFTIE